MSAYQDYTYADEEKYANDSFETDIPESSGGTSDGETDETNLPKFSSREKQKIFTRNDFWTCESSSDDDDVVLGHTIAEINTDPCDVDDENLSLTPAARVFQMASQRKSAGKIIVNDNDEDDPYDVDDENLSLTPAARVFQMASQRKSAGKIIANNNDEDESDDEIDEIESLIEPTESGAESIIFKSHTKLKKQKETTYDEETLFETSGIDVNEVYSDVDFQDGGDELDREESNFFKEIRDEDSDGSCDEENLQDFDNKSIYEEDQYVREESDTEKNNDEGNLSLSSEKTSPSGSDIEDDDKTIGAASPVEKKKSSNPEDELINEPKKESKTLLTDDSMEEFKRKVLLSQRMRCSSDGGGDQSRLKMRKSNIPVWVGSQSAKKLQDSLKSTKSALDVRSAKSDSRTHGSLPDFSDAETFLKTQPYGEKDGAYGFDDELAGGEFNYYLSEDFKTDDMNASIEDGAFGYSVQMELFTERSEIPKKPKKLKAGERRNKSFSNERLRDIERHNQILLHKILNQKPTYVAEDKKKKKDKFSGLPPTTRVTSAEINRKKQQRQIDMDNQMLKRKLEAIAKRKPNKQK